MTSAERKSLIESYGQAANRLKAGLPQYPREMWRYKPSPTQWSIHECIVHVADSEANSFVRCRRFIAEPGSKVMGYDQDVWAQTLDYHRRDPYLAVELFSLLRASSYDLIKDLPESVWANTIDHSENGIMTFDQWLLLYEDHTHLPQIQRIYDHWLANGSPAS